MSISKAFVSRVGLLRSLSQHLLRGKWVAMIGGPMIGKTTLAGRLTDLINDAQNRVVIVSPLKVKQSSEWWSLVGKAFSSQGFLADTNNFNLGPTCSLSELISQLQNFNEKESHEPASRKLILLIDDCDRILHWSAGLIAQIVGMVGALPFIHAVCWIGGPGWGDWVVEHPDVFKVPVRLYPLSVVPLREARAILLEYVGSEEAERVWYETGGHPFLIEKYLEDNNGMQTHNLSKRLWQELQPEEEKILSQLDPNGAWMILEDVKDTDGHRVQKALIDRLCMIGLTVRTLDQGRAVIRITSPLLTHTRKT
jgi:hypothetical protein